MKSVRPGMDGKIMRKMFLSNSGNASTAPMKHRSTADSNKGNTNEPHLIKNQKPSTGSIHRAGSLGVMRKSNKQMGGKPAKAPGVKMNAAQDKDGAYNNPGAKLQMKRKAKNRVNDHDADDKYKRKSGSIKHTGSFEGKSNRLGQGGRAAQMRAQGVPGGVIGAIARREGAAPGQRNYHKSR